MKIFYISILLFVLITYSMCCTVESDDKTVIEPENTGGSDVLPTDSVVSKTDSVLWAESMAVTLMKDFPQMWAMEDRTEPKWEYTYGLVGFSFLELWKITGKDEYFQYVKSYTDKLINAQGNISTYSLADYNIDRVMPGRMVFVLFEKTGDARYKTVIETLRNQLKTHPRTDAGGFWHKKRYPHQMWLDGLYMGAPFYAQYARDYNEAENFDDVINWIVTMEQKALDEKTGLLYHAWDESKQQKWANKQTGCAPNFWGRAMGWYAMALVDVLDYIPESHPKRQTVIDILNRMMVAISKVQDSSTGCWYQVLDRGGDDGNYLEGSVTSMFAYTILKAVRKNYIDKSYLEMGQKAFNGITTTLMKKENDGRIIISPVCAVAGLGGTPYRDGSYEYYVNEAKRDNDPKATGPFILAAIEMYLINLNK